MKISIKNRDQILGIRKASRLVGECLNYLKDLIKPGIPTAELDRLGEEFIRRAGGRPAFKGFQGYPASVCISLNEEVVHGIPSPFRMIRSGDLVSLDVGVEKDGYYGDSALSVFVGNPTETVKRLMDTTEQALYLGIAAAKPGNKLGDISAAIQTHCEKAGFAVVRDLVGHGVGLALHEPPQIPNYGKPNSGPRLLPGMTLAIEPMINQGKWAVETLNDGWTVVTKDRSLSVHFEHTIVITETGTEILTEIPK